ncbi:MAG: phosphopantothenoylcysteine synthetase/decarboxylase [Bacillariaceae sp.]|jgi:phosphopantothenoylcysteine synthetase/decarboxylase
MSLPNNGHQRRPRILFAVTGSVAAVKGPEIAVRLVKELDFDVRILLTHGGENFWNKAKDYNQRYWNSLQDLLSEEVEENIAVVDDDDDDDDDNGNSSPSNTTRRISICCA